MTPLIHLWVPGLFDFKGGIQTYSRFLLQALETVLPQAQIRVFILHDHSGPPSHSPQVNFQTTGHLPARLRTAAFSLLTLQAGLQERPDLVITTHVNFTPVARWLKHLAGVPYWAIAHGFEAWNVTKPKVRQGIEAADQILAVSRYTCDRMLQSLTPQATALLPNTFDPTRFQIQPKPPALLQYYGLRPDQPVILTVNRLEAREPFHSYDQILAALPALRRSLPDVHYLIVGKGDDRPRLEQLIADQGLSDGVTLAGFVPDAALPDHYALCDVFAMPSTLEGFGIVYLEAMACGKPVLAGLDGAQDALLNGQLGVLVDPMDRDAIAAALHQILAGTYPNPLLYQPQKLRQAVLAAFGPAAFQQTLAAHLKPVLGYENPPPHPLRLSPQRRPQFGDSQPGPCPASTGSRG